MLRPDQPRAQRLHVRAIALCFVGGRDDIRQRRQRHVIACVQGVILERRQVAVAERARETARAHFDFARTRLQGGMGTSLDDARAEQELRTNEARVATLSTALARARAAVKPSSW